MKILVTGGVGFVGSHAAEYYANQGDEVIVYDNVSRAEPLNYSTPNAMYNWNYLKDNFDITLIKGDMRDAEQLERATNGVDVIIHIAASGTFNEPEAARKTGASVVYCSTNKVYGDNVNTIKVTEKDTRYEFADKNFRNGIPESFSTDLCEHTPYGASKFSGDVYV